MSKYTKKDIIRLVEEEDVEFIRLQFTDMFGTMKNVAITSNQLEKALENECMFDGSSIEGFVRIEESDMYLYPDLDTFAIFPWRPQQGKVARIICDVYRPDGKPFAGDPRYVLRRVVEDVYKRQRQWQLHLPLRYHGSSAAAAGSVYPLEQPCRSARLKPQNQKDGSGQQRSEVWYPLF